MPKLPVYTAPEANLPVSGGRRATPVGSELGRFGATVTKAADAYLTSVEDEESRKALISSSELRAKYARALDNAALSEEDTGRLKEQMQDEFSKIGENFQTKRGTQALQLYAANTDLMFDEQANKIRVDRAGANARLEGMKFLNTAGELIQRNPGYLAFAEGDAEAFVSTLHDVSPGQRAEIAAKLKSELNQSAAVASARIDPEGTKKRLEAGEWDLTPDQRSQAINKADEQRRARQASEDHARAVAEFERKQRDEAATHKYMNQIVDGTLTGKALERAITSDPDLDANSVQQLVMFAEHRATELTKGEKKSNPSVLRQLWLDIHVSDDDPRKVIGNKPIVAAVLRGDLNTTDGNKLLADVANQKDVNNRSIGSKLRDLSINFNRAVTADLRLIALTADQRAMIQNDYVARVYEQVESMRNENDVPGLRALFDPKDKRWVGHPEFMKQSIDSAAARLIETLPKPPVVNSQKEYDALPSGAVYIDSAGKTGTKPERRKSAGKPPAPLSERRQAQRGSQEPFLIPQQPGKLDLGR